MTKSTELTVVGDSLLDRDVLGTADRLSPDAPVPVLERSAERSRPGGAALAAALAARNGLATTLVTAIADDEAGEELRRLLAAEGVNIVGPRLEGSTPEKVRMLSGDRLLLRLDREAAASPIGSVDQSVLDRVASAPMVVVSDYGRGICGEPDIRDALGTRSHETLWDPHPRGWAPPAGILLATPNLRELNEATGSSAGGLGAVAQNSLALRDKWQTRAVATTLGDRGVLLVDGDSLPLTIPVAPVSATDSCGAGDAFITAVASTLLAGGLLSEAVTEAAAAAADFVGAGGGGGCFAPDHHPSTLGRHLPLREGSTVDPPEPVDAQLLAERVRSRGGTVVVAGGCFDLLHPGHLSTLHAARRLGDCVIVALNSDSSVRRLKGPGRPVVSQHDRASLLAELSCVDAVALFEEDTPCALLERLRPDVFVKGGDYAAQTMVENETLLQWGGQAVVVPYLARHSTTRLIDAVQQR